MLVCTDFSPSLAPPPLHTAPKLQPELPYPDDSFDFVTIPNSMEFFTDPRLVMREAYRVLKPKGLCLVPFTSQGAYKVQTVRVTRPVLFLQHSLTFRSLCT